MNVMQNISLKKKKKKRQNSKERTLPYHTYVLIQYSKHDHAAGFKHSVLACLKIFYSRFPKPKYAAEFVSEAQSLVFLAGTNLSLYEYMYMFYIYG